MKKWNALIILTIAAFVMGAEQRCSVSELQSLALLAHDPRDRKGVFLKWLQSNGKFCSEEKLLYIQNRRAEWLGTADSGEIQTIINEILEKK